MHLEQLIKKCGDRLQSLHREGDWWAATASPDCSCTSNSRIAETPQRAVRPLLQDLEKGSKGSTPELIRLLSRLEYTSTGLQPDVAQVSRADHERASHS